MIEQQLTYLRVLLRALFSIACTCFGLLLIVFIILRVVPTDPALAALGDGASQEAYHAMRSHLGLDLPLYRQFWRYMLQITQGDFGYSLLTSNLVLDDIRRVLPATIELAVVAICVGATLGVASGVVAAFYHNKWQDHLLRVVTLFGNSISIFWLGLMALIIFYAKLGVAPAPGRLDVIYATHNHGIGFILLPSLLQGNWPLFWDACRHIMLPGAVLAYYNLSHISRMTRLFVIEQLSQEYVTTARIKGLTDGAILLRHVLPNIKVPLVTILILNCASLFEGSSFVETIFMWPGLGFYLTKSLRAADTNAILAATLFIGFSFVCFNMLADYLYKYLDPRT